MSARKGSQCQVFRLPVGTVIHVPGQARPARVESVSSIIGNVGKGKDFVFVGVTYPCDERVYTMPMTARKFVTTVSAS